MNWALCLFLMLAREGATAEGSLPAWDAVALRDGWAANADMVIEGLEEHVLKARTQGPDPIFMIEGLELPARPWQYLVLRIQADRAGLADFFWTGDASGPNGGLEEAKKTRFEIPASDTAREVVVFPFWHSEGTIKTLRLDLYDGVRFGIESLEVREWGSGKEPDRHTREWHFGGDLDSWRIHPTASEHFSPPLSLSVKDHGWVTLEIQSRADGTASLLWASEASRGVQSEQVQIVGDGKRHAYNLELSGNRAWTSPIVALGFRLPPELQGGLAGIKTLRISDEPTGPEWFEVVYFGFEEGLNRQGQSARVLAAIRNRGGSVSRETRAALNLAPEEQVLPPLEPGDQADLFWELPPGADPVQVATLSLGAGGTESGVLARTELRFDPTPPLPPAGSIPPPNPVETEPDVCAYYFPGWDSASKWDCIRRWAPNRQPLLGYYDEGNPECVDWQIKWAVENGITCFLVDWYWIRGNQHLTHWFEAYRKCRFRDHLKVALMWANHNPKGSHSLADWEAVSEEWIENYFSLPSYYRIDGKPALFLWDPSLVREDLGGSEQVRRALTLSQGLARDAGFPGIRFVAMSDHAGAGQARTLLEEGYEGATNYHEWGTVIPDSLGGGRARFREVVESASSAWANQERVCGKLTYYPIVDTGWDARPWHGEKSLVIGGRTPQLFEDLLRQAKQYCEDRDLPFVALGPVNEWGEGSYIEPCTEFGFQMYEAIRRVFAKGDPSSWPINLGPRDVGLGPYDFPPVQTVSQWTFEGGHEGWKAMMNISDLRAEGGVLKFRTTSPDPALLVSIPEFKASGFSRAVLRMRIVNPPLEGNQAQLFWSLSGAPASESTSLSIPLLGDTEFHDYVFELSGHPRWKGRIPTFRLDPCSREGIEAWIDEFRFE
ncbi:MAG: glycoside hydrolase family 99-like domain-containing protein [Candidatus Omnitrophica bacterium]|nr:glycoside hydrolase family 99-like domain-containing protein [Candidatus Omnitrophota bacterium]